MAEKTALDEAVERQYKGLSFDELNALYDDEMCLVESYTRRREISDYRAK